MNGIINLLKPPCMSSAQAVGFIKRLTGLKAGHAGTLDPEAAGVLPVMVGKATRLFDFLTEREKVYVAEVAFGAATDTQDATGTVIRTGGPLPSRDQVAEHLSRFVGIIPQVPPSYSALKRDGKPLYRLARRGEHVSLDPRPVEIYQIQYLAPTGEDGHLLRITCGKGTYIRTLCQDLGEALEVPAHMRLLIREESSGLHIRQSITLEQLEERWVSGHRQGQWLMTMHQAVEHLPEVRIEPDRLRACLNGMPVAVALYAAAQALSEGAAARVSCGETLVGIYTKRGENLRIRLMLHGDFLDRKGDSR